MRDVLDLDRRFQHVDEEGRVALLDWQGLLAHRCVVVLGEGGIGKTTEFKARCGKRRGDGEFSFFCELVALAENGLEQAQMFSLEMPNGSDHVLLVELREANPATCIRSTFQVIGQRYLALHGSN